MKSGKARAKLLSKYVSAQMSEEKKVKKEGSSTVECKEEAKSYRKSPNYSDAKQTPKDGIRFEMLGDGASYVSRNNDTTHGSVKSLYPNSPYAQLDKDIKSEFKDSQLEVRSSSGIQSMPSKKEEIPQSSEHQRASYNHIKAANNMGIQHQMMPQHPYPPRNMNYPPYLQNSPKAEYPDFTQGSNSMKLETDSIKSGPQGYHEYMGHPMSMQSHMMQNMYQYPYGPNPHNIMSQPIENNNILGNKETQNSRGEDGQNSNRSNQQNHQPMMGGPMMSPMMHPNSPYGHMQGGHSWYPGPHGQNMMGHPRPMFYPHMMGHPLAPRMIDPSRMPKVEGHDTKEENDANDNQSDHGSARGGKRDGHTGGSSRASQNNSHTEVSTAPTENDIYQQYRMMEINNMRHPFHMHRNMMPMMNSLGVEGVRYISNNHEMGRPECRPEPKQPTGVVYPDDKPILQNIVST